MINPRPRQIKVGPQGLLLGNLFGRRPFQWRMNTPDSPRPPHLPDELWASECACVNQRRRSGKEVTTAPPGASPAPNMVGVAFSGGGIRSATISLGILQGLARVGLLRFVDYVSSVSGGGYVSTYLGGLFLRWKTEAGVTRAEGDDWARVTAALEDSKGHPIDWLRENGRYLAPNGAGDLSVAVAVVLRNLVAVHVVLGVTFVTALLAANGLRRLATRGAELGFPEGAARIQGILVGPDMWWSPLFVLPALVLVLWALPMGLAYWLVRTDEKDTKADGKADGTEAFAPALTVVLLAVLAGLGWMSADRWFGDWSRFVSRLSLAVLLISVPALVAWYVSLRFPLPARGRPGGKGGAAATALRWVFVPSHTSAAARSFLTFGLRSALLVVLATGVFALVDSLGQTIFVRWKATGQLAQMARWVGGGFSTLATLATVAQRFGGLFTRATRERPKVPAAILAMVAAAVLVGVMLTSLATFAHAMTWAADSPERVPSTIDPARYFTCLCLGSFLTLAFGRMYSFVNRSSLAALYGARLARAYLGASNRARAGDAGKSLATLLDDDDLDLASYRPHERGGPLHLINVTVNETTAGRSQVEQRDRKGMGMAIGPAGISVGVRHHARWTEFGTSLRATAAPSLDPVTGVDDAYMFRVFPRTGAPFSPKWPTLGHWMAISGAAVSTGLGSRTSLSLSLLIGLLNLRLGHWWRSGVDPADRTSRTPRPSWVARAIGAVARLLPVQGHLLSELLARFPGTSTPDWYLSDGGHFENTGAYELIRRRLPLIVVCDNGADDDGSFDDLGNLVRKARTDFGASIAFLRPPELREIFSGSGPIGSLEDLGFREPTGWRAAGPAGDGPAPVGPAPLTPPPSGRACRYAAIARVTYTDDAEAMSLLLLLRPAVLGVEPADILSYHAQNPDFPQQSTADQFFDEAQWESYRRLGELMACTVFSSFAPTSQASTSGGWRPFPAKLYQRPSDDCSSN
jgi:hypothetical protein